MGATRQWKIDTPNPHTVRIEYAHGARMLVYVDETLVPIKRITGDSHFDDVCEYAFEIDCVPCLLRLTDEKPHQLWISDVLQPDPIPV